MKPQKLKVSDPINGFTERDAHSKAILNTDVDSLLKYKIQKKNIIGRQEIEGVKNEMSELKSELNEIKALLLKIVRNNQE